MKLSRKLQSRAWILVWDSDSNRDEFLFKEEFYSFRGGCSILVDLDVENFTLLNFVAFNRRFVFHTFALLICLAMWCLINYSVLITEGYPHIHKFCLPDVYFPFIFLSNWDCLIHYPRPHLFSVGSHTYENLTAYINFRPTMIPPSISPKTFLIMVFAYMCWITTEKFNSLVVLTLQFPSSPTSYCSLLPQTFVSLRWIETQFLLNFKKRGVQILGKYPKNLVKTNFVS